MKNKTVPKMTDKQRSDLIATMAGAIPADLSFDEAQAIIGKEGPFVADIREVFAKRCAIPGDDVWFDLEVDNNINPMDLVTAAGHNISGRQQYLGPEFFSGKLTYRVKLVRLGYVGDLKEARRKADEMGYRLVEGQAREPFKTMFPKSDGKGPIIFGGSEWQDPYGRASVTFLHSFEVEWDSLFRLSSNVFHDNWRWLVVGVGK